MPATEVVDIMPGGSDEHDDLKKTDGHEPKVYRFIDLVARYPKASYGIGCCVHCFNCFLFILLVMAVGSKFLTQSSGVALHIWENEWMRTMRAHDEGQKMCNWDSSLTSRQEQQTVARIPSGKEEYELDLVYKADNGNMLDKDALTWAKKLEDKIVGHADYPKFCLRGIGSTECLPPLSLVSACNPGVSPGNSCEDEYAYPPGFLKCTTTQCHADRSQWEVDQSFIDKKANQYATFEFMSAGPKGSFETNTLSALDSGFGAGSTSAVALKSQFRFGFPLDGFNSTSDRSKEQVEKIEEFMTDAYFDLLDEYNTGDGKDAPYLIGYAGGPLADDSINKILNNDFKLVGLSFFVVWIYCALMSQSIFFASMAMGQIFLCFFGGFILYRIIGAFGGFFGTFHIMAIFLLMGIGVDDVFVMLDHFEAAPSRDDMSKRMSWTWKHAAMAMGVTSLTTSVSFIMNTTSSFFGIGAFGLFAACLIAVNYVSMVFFFPTVISFNEQFFKKRNFLCGLVLILNRLFANTSPEKKLEAAKAEVVATDQHAHAVAQALEALRKAGGDKFTETQLEQRLHDIDMKRHFAEGAETKNSIVKFFEGPFSWFILANRLKILAVFLGISIFMFTRLPLLEPEKTAPKFLPETHPIEQYGNIMREEFVRGGSIFNTEVSIMFGFADDFLSNEGVDGSGEGWGEKDDIGSQGDAKFDGIVSDVSKLLPNLDCLADICDRAEVKNSKMHTGGPPAYPIKGCWPRDLRNYVDAKPSGALTWAQITAGDAQSEMVFGTQFEAMGLDESYPSQDGYVEHVFAENVNGEPVYRYFLFSITLTSDPYIDSEEGNQLADDWKAFLDNEMATGSCVGSGFSPLIHSGSFHQFKVTELLMSEMFSGIFTSILVALFVLIIATGNIFLGLYAAFSIAMIVIWVMAMVHVYGWELGIIENVALVMVPGLSVDYVAHLAEAYNHAHFDEREHRVMAMLSHSGVSVVSGSISTLLAGVCLLLCEILFFTKFGTFLITCILFSLAWSLFFFPSILCVIGPVGVQGDWHRLINPNWTRDFGRYIKLDGITPTQTMHDNAKGKRECACCIRRSKVEPE